MKTSKTKKTTAHVKAPVTKVTLTLKQAQTLETKLAKVSTVPKWFTTKLGAAHV